MWCVARAPRCAGDGRRTARPARWVCDVVRAGGRQIRVRGRAHGTSINNNAAARILDGLGVLDRIELVELPEVYRLKGPDLDVSVPQRDPEAYAATLAKYFPDEKDGIGGFVRYMVDLAGEADRFDR